MSIVDLKLSCPAVPMLLKKGKFMEKSMLKPRGSLGQSHPMTDDRSDHYPQFPASFT